MGGMAPRVCVCLCVVESEGTHVWLGLEGDDGGGHVVLACTRQTAALNWRRWGWGGVWGTAWRGPDGDPRAVVRGGARCAGAGPPRPHAVPPVQPHMRPLRPTAPPPAIKSCGRCTAILPKAGHSRQACMKGAHKLERDGGRKMSYSLTRPYLSHQHTNW